MTIKGRVVGLRPCLRPFALEGEGLSLDEHVV